MFEEGLIFPAMVILLIIDGYATEAAKRRPNYKGGFFDLTENEANAAPDWVAPLNMIFSIVGLIMMIIGIVIRVI